MEADVQAALRHVVLDEVVAVSQVVQTKLLLEVAGQRDRAHVPEDSQRPEVRVLKPIETNSYIYG